MNVLKLGLKISFWGVLLIIIFFIIFGLYFYFSIFNNQKNIENIPWETAEVKFLGLAYTDDSYDSIYEYHIERISRENIIDDFNKYFKIYCTAPINFKNIIYEGSRLVVDLDMDINKGETFGSFGGRVYRVELLYTFASFPNVQEIIFLFRGEKDLYGGGHFNISGVFDAVKISNLDETYDLDYSYIFELNTEKRLLIGKDRFEN
ncbi:MAG: hypothetical protein LBI28_06625 [Treponema sp.]|jgi:hypothetical protein|nr:hypothetical protein [Treponema sp.]